MECVISGASEPGRRCLDFAREGIVVAKALSSAVGVSVCACGHPVCECVCAGPKKDQTYTHEVVQDRDGGSPMSLIRPGRDLVSSRNRSSVENIDRGPMRKGAFWPGDWPGLCPDLMVCEEKAAHWARSAWSSLVPVPYKYLYVAPGLR